MAIAVSLVGGAPTGAESLALGYLAAALKRVGHRPSVMQFRGVDELESVARQVCDAGAPLLGVALPSGQAALEALGLILLVRRLGYRGHITCGGTFATLARRRLLERHAGIDSVVRHDGERPMVALANAVSHGAAAHGLPGVTTRRGDGTPAEVAAQDALELVPMRSTFPLYAGVRTASLSGVRGCWGKCRYCGLGALRDEAMNEGLAAGMTPSELREASVGALRRRDIDAVADEMAALYHEHEVRYFQFVDENHLPRGAAAAEAAILELDRALAQRAVGPRAVNLMLRADDAHPRVVAALSQLGVVRSLVGVDTLVPSGRRELARGGSSAGVTPLEAMSHVAQHGIEFHFNVLLIRPNSTLDTLEAEIAALRGVRAGLLDLFQVEPFEGTDLFRQLERTGRLRGGPILWHFLPEEPGARRFAELFARCKREATGRVPVTAYAYEVLGVLAVARKLNLFGGHARDATARAAELVEEHNRLWLRTLESALAWAREADADPAGPDASELVQRLRTRAAEITLAFSDLRQAVERSCTIPLKQDIRYPRTTTAAAVAAAILAMAACGGKAESDSSDQPSATGGSAAGGSAAAGSSSTNTGGTTPGGTGATGGGTPGAAGSTTTPAEGGAANPGSSCSIETLREAMWEGLSDCRGCNELMEVNLRFVLDDQGYPTGIERSDGEPISQELVECMLASAGDQQFQCTGGEENVWEQYCVLLA